MEILKGNRLSNGIAVGKCLLYQLKHYEAEESYFEDGLEDQRWQRFEAVLATANQELDSIIGRLSAQDSDKGKIIMAHKEILEDEEIMDEIRSAIMDEHAEPEYAVYSVFSGFIRILSRAKDEMIRSRAADLEDIRNRLLRIFSGDPDTDLSTLSEDVVVVAHDLLPSNTATMSREHVLGIVTEVGGITSHTAIIARSYGIPAVLGVENAMCTLRDGMTCIVDALSGEVVVSPDDDTLESYRQRAAKYRLEKEQNEKYRHCKAVLKSGEEIQIGLNIGSVDKTPDYEDADYVGLLRTEFLYMDSDHCPREDEQTAAYIKVMKNAGHRPVTFRTLDIGGDKTLKYMPLPKEDNPFLGKRALRLCLSEPELFRTQLRAALRASVYGRLMIMFPMVATIDDIRNAKAELEKAKQSLRDEGIAFDENVQVGIMIEIPAIGEIADLAAREVDFASIGTNDLTQYTHAVDRMNSTISAYYQSFSPAMMRSLDRIIREFTKAGKAVSVCGELGGDVRSAAVLVGMGLRKLSMNGAAIGAVKRMLCHLTLTEAQEMAETVKNLPTEAEVLSYLEGKLAQINSRAD